MTLLDSLKSEDDYARERERCAGADGSVYWFGNYAWGYDPRSLLQVQPFDPFEHQERYIRWLDESMFRRRTSGLVEKARDMGATVGALDWIAKCWLFIPGFSAFLVWGNKDLVDSKANPDTLFEKVRFQLRLTPSWMLPEGFNLLRDLPYIANPVNGATISGGAPTENAGRQRRATVVLADEYQSWPGGGFKQITSLSQTSNSVLKLGTPMGMQNQYNEGRALCPCRARPCREPGRLALRRVALDVADALPLVAEGADGRAEPAVAAVLALLLIARDGRSRDRYPGRAFEALEGSGHSLGRRVNHRDRGRNNSFRS